MSEREEVLEWVDWVDNEGGLAEVFEHGFRPEDVPATIRDAVETARAAYDVFRVTEGQYSQRVTNVLQRLKEGQ